MGAVNQSGKTTLIQWRPSSAVMAQHWINRPNGSMFSFHISQHDFTWIICMWLEIDPMLDLCWSTFYSIGQALNDHSINDSCLLGCRKCWKVQWCDWPRYCCDWARWPSRPRMCLRYRSATLRIVCSTNVAMAADAIKIRDNIFIGNIFYCKILFRYHNRFAFESDTCDSVPQLQTLILFNL